MKRKITLNELKEMAAEARQAIWDLAKNEGREPKVYLHWTAGNYDTVFEEYHINITGDGNIYVTTNDLTDVKKHTWRRNTGAVGIALCCCYGGGSASLGGFPPTAKQIETIAQVIFIVADALWLTIDKKHVLTHGEAANNEDGDVCSHQPYSWWNDSYGDGDTRGDLEYLGTTESPCYNPWATDGSRGGDILRGKAIWYKNIDKTLQANT